MIQPVNSISFKRIYVNDSYIKMNPVQSKTTGDIISTLQSINNTDGISLEDAYERQGMDFYITHGVDNNTELYIINNKPGQKPENTSIFIGSYNADKIFRQEDIPFMIKENKFLNVVKAASIILLFGLLTLGILKSQANTNQKVQLTEKIINK